VLWAVVVVAFFSLSQSKLHQYILTAIVALGILVARVFAHGFERSDGLAARLVLRGTVLLAVLSAGAALFFATAQADPTWLARVSNLKGSSLEQWARVFGPMIAPLVALALLAVVARWRRDLRLAFAAFACLPLLVLTLGFGALQNYSQHKSSAALAAHLRALPRETEIVVVECFPTGLPFHLKRYVTLVTKDGRELPSNYIMYTIGLSRPWPERIVPTEELDRWLAARTHPIYLVTQKRGQAKLQEIAARRGVTIEDLPLETQGVLLPPSAGH
jgi:4-amino-4-deoxy-L-arabinose transferase-like glycosyltransferase